LQRNTDANIAILLVTKYVSSCVVAIEQEFIKLIAFTEQVRLRLHYPSWMSGCGTNRTSIDVRSSVAIGGKPDMAPKAHFGSD
jgi:hypothetical protein